MSRSDPKETTKIVRVGLERACKEFTARIAHFGFQRTLKMFWTRRQSMTVDFIHFHRHGSSYGAPLNFSVRLRVHFGIRVLNDPFVAAGLNGPWSDDPAKYRAERYHLRFNAKSGDSFDRCLNDLIRFVEEQGEPWFRKFRAVDDLLRSSESPLRPLEKQLLQEALAGHASPENMANSLKIFGIKSTAD